MWRPDNPQSQPVGSAIKRFLDLNLTSSTMPRLTLGPEQSQSTSLQRSARGLAHPQPRQTHRRARAKKGSRNSDSSARNCTTVRPGAFRTVWLRLYSRLALVDFAMWPATMAEGGSFRRWLMVGDENRNTPGERWSHHCSPTCTCITPSINGSKLGARLPGKT